MTSNTCKSKLPLLFRFCRFGVFLWFVTGVVLPAYGEIYRWVDERGRVQFSEHPPENRAEGPVDEISGSLANVGNFTGFARVVDLEWYKPPGNFRHAEVEIDIRLHRYNLSAMELERMREQVNGIYEAFTRWFGWNYKPSRPVVINIFGRYEDFEAYQLEKYDGHLASNRSHYSRARKEVLMLGSEFSEATLSLLYHEATHAIMDMESVGTPKWINEGLATVFETVEVEGKRVKIGIHEGWKETLQQSLREGSLSPARSYLAISSSQWSASSAQVEHSYYMIAWSLIRFLLSSQEGIDALREVMSHRQRSPWWNPYVLLELFEQGYPGGLERLDADWRRWIERL